jgi:two-component system sensor histidine kinase UhpB
MLSRKLGRLVSRFNSTQGVELRKETAPSPNRPFDTVQIALLVAILYYAGTKIGFFFKPAGVPISIFWTPNALLLAAFLLTPKRLWWALLVAVLPAHLLAQLPAGVPVARALGWFAGNIGEALLGAICIRYFRRQERLFDSVRGLITFLVFGVLVAPLLTSFLDVGVVRWTGEGGDYWTMWMMRLSSNMIANMSVVPTVWFFGRRGMSWLRKATLEQWVEACVLAFGVVFVSVLVFNRDYAPATHLPAMVFAPLPFLLWASIRFGSGALSASILVVVVIASWHEIHGNGLVSSASTAESVFYLHILLTLFALPSMALAAVIAERRRAEELLQGNRNKLIHWQEQERLRIARELHDDLAQQLTLLGLELGQLRTGLDPSLKSRLQGLHDQLVDISNATRDLSHELHPFALEYLGLVAALRNLCRRVSMHNNLTVTFREQNVPQRLDASVSLCLYRVTQEALQNITTQSKAHAVNVELKVVWGQAWLLIADDGLGLSPEQMYSGNIGLASARERLMGLNGTLKIMSEPEKGTTIEASVPLPPS